MGKDKQLTQPPTDGKKDDVNSSPEGKEPQVQKKQAKKTNIKKSVRSKRYVEAKRAIVSGKEYTIEEAIELLKKTAITKFDASIEVHLRLGIDVKKGDQQIRGTVSLPHGTGKILKVAAFVKEDKENEAKDAGADIVGGDELIQKIKQTEKIDFDIAVTTPDMMPKLASVAKILGPKGLMPSPKNETITTNLKKTIQELKKGKVSFKNDDTGNVHVMIGKISFDSNQLVQNFQTLYSEIKRIKPASSKGVFVKNITVNATMSPGIKISH